MKSKIDSVYPVKKGRLAKDKNENFMLLNSEGQAYSTNSSIRLIWELCSGDSSIKELSRKIKANTKSNSSDLTNKVCEIIQKLKKANLVELKSTDH